MGFPQKSWRQWLGRRSSGKICFDLIPPSVAQNDKMNAWNRHSVLLHLKVLISNKEKKRNLKSETEVLRSTNVR